MGAGSLTVGQSIVAEGRVGQFSSNEVSDWCWDAHVVKLHFFFLYGGFFSVVHVGAGGCSCTHSVFLRSQASCSCYRPVY